MKVEPLHSKVGKNSHDKIVQAAIDINQGFHTSVLSHKNNFLESFTPFYLQLENQRIEKQI